MKCLLDFVKHAFHLFVVRTSNREAIKSKLLDAGVETGIHYPIALPKLKAFNYLNQANEKGFAWVSDKELLSLPISDFINIDFLNSWVGSVLYIIFMLLSILALNSQQRYLIKINSVSTEPIITEKTIIKDKSIINTQKE